MSLDQPSQNFQTTGKADRTRIFKATLRKAFPEHKFSVAKGGGIGPDCLGGASNNLPHVFKAEAAQ